LQRFDLGLPMARIGATATVACALVITVAGMGAASAGCSARTLVLVDSCSDGGGVVCVVPVDSSVVAEEVSGPETSGAPEAPPSTLRQGLVGLWRFDEVAGTTALDSSGNDNHGTLKDLDPATAWVPGHLGGNSLETGGVGYVLVPLSDSIASIVSAVTVSAWVSFDGPIVDYGTAISRQISDTLQQYYHIGLWQADGEPSMYIATRINAVNVHVTAPGPTTRVTWTHLAGTYDGSRATLYVDGTLVASLGPITGRYTMDTTPVILGGNGNNQLITERFPGRIDEIALYNRALDSSEIQKLASGAPF
jgi:Concanavalin A-like lectin/glucanases superfamily